MELKIIFLLTIILKISCLTKHYIVKPNKTIISSNPFFFSVYVSCTLKSTSNLTSRAQIKMISGYGYVNNKPIGGDGLSYNISQQGRNFEVEVDSYSEVSIKNEGPAVVSAYCSLDFLKKKVSIVNSNQINNSYLLNLHKFQLKSLQFVNFNNEFFFTIFPYCYVETLKFNSTINLSMEKGEGYINGLSIGNGISINITKSMYFQVALSQYSKILIKNKGPGNVLAYCGIESQLRKKQFLNQYKNKLISKYNDF